MQKLIELAIENKYNLLLDGTMAGDIERIKNTIELCRNHKYEIEIRFLAVHERLSRLGIYLRYEDQLQDKGYGRFVNRYTHDLNYVQVPKNIRQLYDSGMVDKLGMYDKVPGPHNIKLITEYGPFIDKNIEDFIESLRQHNLKVNQKELNKTIQQLVARMMQRSASSRYIEDFKAIMAL